MRWPIKIICWYKTCIVVSSILIVLYTKDSICSVKSSIFFRMISSGGSGQVHICAPSSQHGVRCIPVHRLRCESGANFCLKLHLHHTQRHTGPYWNEDRSHPRYAWTGSIASQAHSPVMRIGCGENKLQVSTAVAWLFCTFCLLQCRFVNFENY